MVQSVDRKGRYKPVTHKLLGVGDLVSIKQPFSKPILYPMGVVKSVKYNDLGEIVSAEIMKSNRQVLCKHVNDLVLLLKSNEQGKVNFDDQVEPTAILKQSRTLPPKPAKIRAMERLASMRNNEYGFV